MAHDLRIQRKRSKGSRLEAGAVCVTRPGRYGNPFETAAEFRSWLAGEMARPELDGRRRWILEHVRELRGRKLACFCPMDADCHADGLAELANQ